MKDLRITFVIDGELTHDFTGIRLNDDKGIEDILWSLNADSDVHMFVDGVEYSLPPPNCSSMKPSRNSYGGGITFFSSWQYKTLRDHIKHCADIHRAFYYKHE